MSEELIVLIYVIVAVIIGIYLSFTMDFENDTYGYKAFGFLLCTVGWGFTLMIMILMMLPDVQHKKMKKLYKKDKTKCFKYAYKKYYNSYSTGYSDVLECFNKKVASEYQSWVRNQ